MRIYFLDDIHKITITEGAGHYNVQFYELTAGRWAPLGQPETWGKLSDILDEYGIN